MEGAHDDAHGAHHSAKFIGQRLVAAWLCHSAKFIGQSVASMAQRLVAAWVRLLRERPVAANGLQGVVLSASGDALAQRLEAGGVEAAGSSSLDGWRCARAAAVGFLFSGVVVPAFYRRLDAVWPGTRVRAVVCKSFADVAVLGVFGNATSICLRGTAPAELPGVMPGVLANECRVWVPYNLLAFRLVPLHLRPTTTSLLTFCWHTYISRTAADARAPAAVVGVDGAVPDAAAEAPAEAQPQEAQPQEAAERGDATPCRGASVGEPGRAAGVT